jgi:hypothetical protein
MAGADRQQARVNWKTPGLNDLVEVNSPTFVPFRHFAGDAATSYLATGVNPSDPNTKFLQDDCSMGIWGGTLGQAGNNSYDEMAATSGTVSATLQMRNAGNRASFRLNSNSGNTSSAVLATTEFAAVTRHPSSVGNINYYRNNLAAEVSAQPSTGLVSQPLFILANNNNGTASRFSLRSISLAFVGGGLTEAQIAAIYNGGMAFRAGVGL